MAELLLELFSEEIPARMQAGAATELKQRMSVRLQELQISFEKVESFVTPRRLTLVATGIPEQQPDTIVEKKGPRVGAPEAAITGFLKSVSLTLDQLEVRATDKGDFYFSSIEQKGAPTASLLVPAIEQVISSISWPKSMKWGTSTIRWVRPLQNVLCLFNQQVLPVTFGHLTANNQSYGHRFLAKSSFTVNNFADYAEKLRAAFVMLDREERKSIIETTMQKLLPRGDYTVLPDAGLLEEVAGLTEWPVPLLGTIDEQFMHVPKEVLSVSMRTHQKYFSVMADDAQLAPYFITIANMESTDGGKKIIAGNERVLRARLSDARFFFEQDQKKSLESRLPTLGKVVFHAKLGTVLDKAKRLEKLATIIASYIPGADLTKAARAALLAKTDLVSEMVMEFPELQGIMGGYYATHDGEDNEVAEAIAEHYRPLSQNDPHPPSKPISMAVALADKIDTLVGLFAIGEKPTGSKDPFALRRAALGIIRILRENNIRIPLKTVLAESVSLFNIDKADRAELLEFFADRVKAMLKSENIRHDVINAVFDGGNEDNMARLIERANALQSFLESEEGTAILAAYMRATTIVSLEEKKDGASYNQLPDIAKLKTNEEKALYNSLESIRANVKQALKGEQFREAMLALSVLKEPINAFFDNVIVNCEDHETRCNRLMLLSEVRSLLDGVANFEKIEG